MLIRPLALELWPHNIRVNEPVPRPVLTYRVAQSAREPGFVFQDDSEWVKIPEDVVPLAPYPRHSARQGSHRSAVQPHAARCVTLVRASH